MAILGESDVTRRRYAAGSYDSTGSWVGDPSPTDTTIQMSIQPMPGDQVQLLPEGLRTRNVQVGYTESDMITAVANGPRGDQIIDGATTYDVHEAGPWAAVLPHTQVALVEVQES